MSADSTAPPSVKGHAGRIDDPTDLTWPDYKRALMATKAEVKRDDVPSMAAGVAFKIFLAMFPSLIAAVAIFGFFLEPDQLDRYVSLLEGVAPEGALGIIEDALANIADTGAGQAGALGFAGIAGGLWAASSAAATLVKALNRAYEVEENRNFFKQRGVALAITFALLFAILALVLLVIAGPQVQDLVVPEQLAGPVANVAFGFVQIVVVLAVLTALFAFVYWIGPNRELPKWQWMSPGAVFGVVGWLVASLAFTLYVQNFGNYEGNEAYAGLGSVVVLMLWLQISMLVLLIGAEFNAEVERLKAQYEQVSAGAGMGHLEEPADDDEAGVLSAAGTRPAGGGAFAPLPDAARPGGPSGRDDPSEGPGWTTSTAPRTVGGSGTSGTGEVRPGEVGPPAAPAGLAERRGGNGSRAGPAQGSRALAAGAAAAAAAVAAVVAIVRNRD